MPSSQTDTKMDHFSSLVCKSEVTTCQTERQMQKSHFSQEVVIVCYIQTQMALYNLP